MRACLKILFITAMVVCFSCQEQGFIVKCSECTTEEPIEATLKISLDVNNYSPATIVRVYEGDLEDNIKYSTLNVDGSSSVTKIAVQLNKKYTVTATYTIQNVDYIVVDSATPRVRYDEEQCDNPCYYIYDRTVNLKLKYQ
jgi:hypothetical protein